MSDLKRAADICDELAEMFRDAADSGSGHECIDELVAACERAAREIGCIIQR